MRSKVDKYFEGYEKVEVDKKNGKGKTMKYVYRGNYFHVKKSAEETRKYKVFYTIFFLIYMVFYFYTSFLDTDASHTMYVGLISLMLLIPEVYCINGIWNFLSSKEYMEQRKYAFGLKRILASTKVMFYLSIAQIAGEGIFLIIHHSQVNSFFMEGKFVLFAVLEVGILFFFLKIQKGLEIEEIPYALVNEEHTESA